MLKPGGIMTLMFTHKATGAWDPFQAGVYAESGPRLYRYALMILADRQDAEDVVQQVFAAVLSKRTLPLIDEVGAYFRTAVRNAAYSLLRRRRVSSTAFFTAA